MPHAFGTPRHMEQVFKAMTRATVFAVSGGHETGSIWYEWLVKMEP